MIASLKPYAHCIWSGLPWLQAQANLAQHEEYGAHTVELPNDDLFDEPIGLAAGAMRREQDRT